MAQTVKYTFLALDRFSGVAKRVNRHTTGLRRNLGGLSNVAARAGRGLVRIGTIGAVGAVAGLTAVIRAGSTFQDSMADLEAITGLSGDKLAYMGEQAKKLGKASVTSAAEVAGGFKVVASKLQEIAQEPEQIAMVTEQILLLKNAAGISLSEAVEAVTKGLGQFNVGADQAARFVNALAAGAKIGSSEVGEAGRAITKAGVAAKLSGLSFEETGAAIQVLAKGGLVAENAGTLLSSTLLKLEKTGIRNVMPSVVGLATAFENINAAGLDSVQMTELFGEEAIKAGGTLANLAPLIREFTRKMTGTSIAEEQAAIRLATFNTKLRAMKITMQEALIRTFERLEPMLTRVAGQFQGWLDSLGDSDIQSFAASMKTIADAVTTIGGWFESNRQGNRDYAWNEKMISEFGGGASKFSEGIHGGLRAKFGLDVTVRADKGTAAEVTQRTSGSRAYDLLMGVNMDPAL